jgi:hypothetical protein
MPERRAKEDRLDRAKRLWVVGLVTLTVLSVTGCGTPQATHAAVLPAESFVAPTSPTPSPTYTRERISPTPAEDTAETEQVIFRDDFVGVLQEGWSWIEERPTHWSLTKVPGSLHIVTVAGEEWTNMLLREVPPGDWEISTQVTCTPTESFAAAMLYVVQDGKSELMFGRAYCDLPWCAGNAIYFDRIQDGEFADDNFSTAVDSPSLAYLRLRRQGNTFTGYYSQDGEQWITIGQHTTSHRPLRVGLVARGSNSEISADFDYFEIKVSSAGTPQPVRTPTRTPTPTRTRTPTPTRTRAPTRTRTPTPTPTPTPCLPGASFVADITVPDGTAFEMGAAFTKTWQMRSDGCAPWPSGSSWVFVSGDQMGAPASVPVPDTPLGSPSDLSVEMVAPDGAGTYKGVWQMQSPDGTRFGDQAHVMIVVKESPPRRLSTGTIIRETGARNGLGQLTIGNDLDLDAVAVLSQQEGSWVFAVYILNHDSHVITGVPDGSYELYFTVGEDWDAQQATFTRKRRLSRFDDPLTFTTTETTYSGWSVTLHPVTGGTATTETVPEDQFPDLK